jgi:DNA-binding NarL/FixJ family response regulator
MLKLKIFLVDDHPVYLEGLKSILMSEDSLHLVGTASDGLSAFESICKHLPDISIVDIGIPKMNGIELIKKVQARHSKTKFIVLSQMNDEATIREVIKLNVSGYVLKSEGMDEIFKAISTVSKGMTYYGHEVSQSLYQFNQDSFQKKRMTQELSEREKQVVVLISKGKSVREIASDLGCSENTIKTHKSNIMRKIEVSNSAGVSAWAYKTKLVE